MAPGRVCREAGRGITVSITATVLLCGPPLSAVGGGPTHIKNMLTSPLRDQYRLVHFETGSRGAESPATDESLSARTFRIVTSPLELAWTILNLRPSIVHLNSVLNRKAFLRDAVYLLVSKSLQRRVVFQFHGGSLSTLCASKWMQLVVRTVYSIPDALVLLATSEKTDLEKLGICSHLAIIPNGVDVPQFRGTLERVHSGRVQRLIYMGRLVREKGIFEAIKAIEILRKTTRFEDIKLRIAGSGPATEELEAYIAERGLGNSVELVGPVYGNAKVEFLREADAFIFPSYHPEGLPYSILESLAAGTPVVASKVAGIPDVVVDRVHGILLTNPRDPAEIVSAVQELDRSQEALRIMSRNCIDWATTQLGLERLATQFGELYETVRL